MQRGQWEEEIVDPNKEEADAKNGSGNQSKPERSGLESHPTAFYRDVFIFEAMSL
jgi:hypothetical protein